jgi:BirA family biotin operon repressor/biotin-[acetyl-CoA-carboxylase] ligase
MGIVLALFQDVNQILPVFVLKHVFRQRRKLAGVLIESRPGPGGGVWYALGFGINCLQHRGHFPPDLRPRATSLDLECPASIDRTAVLQHVLHELDRWTAAPETWDPAAICARWREHSLPLGSRISILHEGTVFVGQVVDIDPTAALLVELDQGVRRLFPAAGCTIVD